MMVRCVVSLNRAIIKCNKSKDRSKKKTYKCFIPGNLKPYSDTQISSVDMPYDQQKIPGSTKKTTVEQRTATKIDTLSIYNQSFTNSPLIISSVFELDENRLLHFWSLYMNSTAEATWVQKSIPIPLTKRFKFVYKQWAPQPIQLFCWRTFQNKTVICNSRPVSPEANLQSCDFTLFLGMTFLRKCWT